VQNCPPPTPQKYLLQRPSYCVQRPAGDKGDLDAPTPRVNPILSAAVPDPGAGASEPHAAGPARRQRLDRLRRLWLRSVSFAMVAGAARSRCCAPHNFTSFASAHQSTAGGSAGMSAKRNLSTSTLRRKSVRSRDRAEPRLVIEAGAPDRSSVSEAIREWIVTVLVRKFIAEQSVLGKSPSMVISRKLATDSLDKERR
jgi:hypothetical protein